MALAMDTLGWLLLAAFVAGFIDAMAGGGGLLTLPALLAAGIPPVPAIATNKLQGCFGTGGAFLAYWRRGLIDLRPFALAAGVAFAGSAAGAVAVQHAGPTFVAGIVPVLLVAMAAYFLFAPAMGEADRHARLGRFALLVPIAAVGFYDGFFGPGTGSFFTVALVALGGLGLVRAIAHAKLLNFATNLSALGAMVAGGQVLWSVGLPMAAASVLGNQAGVLTAVRFKGRGVRVLLVVISLALTIRLLSDPANPLRTALTGRT